MTEADIPRSRSFVSAFSRGLDVIEAFGHEHPRMTLSEVAAAARVDRAVARRLLLTLVELGFARSDGKQFELTPRVLRLGYSYLSSLSLDSISQPILDELSILIKEPVSITVLDDADVVYVARSDAANRHVSFWARTGMRIPAAVSASGRMLMSALPNDELSARLQKLRIPRHTKHSVTSKRELLEAIRKAGEAGFCVVSEEFEIGLLACSVLVRNRGGRIIGALNASSHTSRMTAKQMTSTIVPRLLEYARQLSRNIL